jgi:hypothetical protein
VSIIELGIAVSEDDPDFTMSAARVVPRIFNYVIVNEPTAVVIVLLSSSISRLSPIPHHNDPLDYSGPPKWLPSACSNVMFISPRYGVRY